VQSAIDASITANHEKIGYSLATIGKEFLMYRCKICGNTDFFEGHVLESGRARISQMEDGSLSWCFYLSDDSDLVDIDPGRCGVCHSEDLERIGLSMAKWC
jgi:hypothetical protein